MILPLAPVAVDMVIPVTAWEVIAQVVEDVVLVPLRVTSLAVPCAVYWVPGAVRLMLEATTMLNVVENVWVGSVAMVPVTLTL